MKTIAAWKERICRNIQFADTKPITAEQLKKWVMLERFEKEDSISYQKDFQQALDELVADKECVVKTKSGKYRAMFEGEMGEMEI